MLVKHILNLQSNCYFLFIVEKRGSNNATKNKRLSKGEIKKKQSVDSLINNEKEETKVLNKQVEKVENSEDTAKIEHAFKIKLSVWKRIVNPKKLTL